MYRPVVEPAGIEPPEEGAVVNGAVVKGTVTDEDDVEFAENIAEVVEFTATEDDEAPVLNGTEGALVPLGSAETVVLVPFPYSALPVLEAEMKLEAPVLRMIDEVELKLTTGALEA